MVNDGLLLLLALMTLLLVMFAYAVIMLSPGRCPHRTADAQPARAVPYPVGQPAAADPRGPRGRSAQSHRQPGALMPLPVRAQRCPGAGSPARRRGNQRTAATPKP